MGGKEVRATRSTWSRFILVVAVVGLALGVAGSVDAGVGPPLNTFNILIDDLTEGTPTATNNNTPITPLSDSAGEFLHFHVPLTILTTNSVSASEDLLEADGTTFSDRLFVSNVGPGTEFLDVLFASDPATAPLGTTRVFTPIVENGASQFLFFFTNGTDRVNFSVASDVEPAPEPATLALLGIGLAGLGFSRRQRNQ
jgi:hypothetical protein